MNDQLNVVFQGILNSYADKKLIADAFNYEDEKEIECKDPYYSTCMCCGNVQSSLLSCNRCGRPTTVSWLNIGKTKR